MSSEDTKAIRDAYFNACNFESLMRGIHFAVFWMALVHIYTGQQRGPSHILAFLVVAMFIMSTVHHATFWAYVRRAFIAHGETSESVAAALDEYPDWFTGTTSISDANAVLADGILIWRTWIVWGRNWWVIIAPVATTLLTAAFSIIATYGVVSSTTFGAVGVDYATALYSTSLVTTVVCTCLIVFRILSVSQYKKNAWRSYRNIMEILIESALLYSVATLFALLAYIYSGEASEYASAFWTSITGIAPTLIIARVASGESRPEDTWREGTTHSGSTIPRFRFTKGRADSGTVSGGNPTDVGTFVAAIPMGSLRSEGEVSSGMLSTQHSQGVSDVKKRDLDSEV